MLRQATLSASALVSGIFREYGQKHSQTLLIVTHDPDFVRRTDHIIRMQDGRINPEPCPALCSGMTQIICKHELTRFKSSDHVLFLVLQNLKLKVLLWKPSYAPRISHRRQKMRSGMPMNSPNA